MSEDEMTEEERLEAIRTLKETVPEGVDIEGRLAGSLAGPVTPDRPDVPPWEYPEYMATHLGVTLEYLAHVRFPIRLEPTGHVMPTSIHEGATLGASAGFAPMPYLDQIDSYAVQHALGVFRWEVSERTVVHDAEVPFDPVTYRAAWRERIAKRLANG